jgi:hypothetical protein
MKQQLSDAFASEISALTAQLADERAQLDEVPEDCDPEVVATARDRIEMLQELIAKVQEARHLVAMAEAEAGARALRYVQWLAAIRDVNLARARLEEFVPLIRQAQEAVDAAEAARTNKQAALTAHLNNPVPEPQFASPAKLKKWNATKQTLEASLAAQARVVREASAALKDLHFERQKANDALFARPGGAMFRAEQLQPRQPQKAQTFGRLEAVN